MYCKFECWLVAAVQCGAAPEIANTNGQATGDRYKDTITYSCTEGYDLYPTKPTGETFTVRCAENAVWTSASKTCQSKIAVHCLIADYMILLFWSTSLSDWCRPKLMEFVNLTRKDTVFMINHWNRFLWYCLIV